MMNRTKQLLIAARALVSRPGGWCQGDFCNENGAVCALGAINRADLDASPEELTDAKYALCAALPPGHEQIMWFNDDRGRTQAEIVAVFDRAIASAE